MFKEKIRHKDPLISWGIVLLTLRTILDFAQVSYYSFPCGLEICFIFCVIYVKEKEIRNNKLNIK